MTVHPVQVPNSFPYPRLDPVTGPLVHLATNLSAIHAETARSGVTIKTGKETSVIPTQTNNFLAECVDLHNIKTSIRGDAVPVPKDSVPRPPPLSGRPVSPAVETDSSAAAESPRTAYPADGDNTLLTFYPLTTVASLESQGLATIFLRPSGPDNRQFSATGQLLETTDITCQYIRTIYLLDDNSLFRLNTHLWTLLNAAFDLSAFTELSPKYSAAHAYKLLLILLYNRTHYARVSITKAIQMLPSNPCTTGAELAALNSSVVAYSVLHNVLNGKFAFNPVAEILHHVTDGIHRATSTLPTHLQTDFRQAAQVLNSRFSRALEVHPTALLLRMTPTLQPPLEPSTSASQGPANFVTLMAGTTPDNSSVFTSSAPSAFMARRGSAPISDRERYERPTHPRSGTRDRPRPSHDRPPSSLRRDDTRDFERRPPSSIRRDDTADCVWSASRPSSLNSELIAAAAATA